MSSSPDPEQPAASGLPERDTAILDFEREWWQHAGAKEEAIRETFGLSAARYYQMLNAVIDSPDAVRYDPMLIKRLQRARETRAQARATRALANSRPQGRAVHNEHDETTN